MATQTQQASRIQILGEMREQFEEILTPEALEFLAGLNRKFNSRRLELLRRRIARQRQIDAGILPDFLPETVFIRDSDWQVAPIPPDLLDRRVEITGPVDRKMVINALNSGASVFMADFEDSNSPLWSNNIEGQINLRDAVNRTIRYTSPEGKPYELKPQTATLLVRPRGWHLEEKHFLVDGVPMSGSLFDFGLFFFHNTRRLLQQGTGPYFYLPKLENHLEARLWNDVFLYAQHELGIPYGTIRATVLIETILAAFEMNEILWELREHSAGLNCGRWDYIFSFIKKFRTRPDSILPDRALVTMDRGFLASYVQLLIETCHRRGIHAMGGMAAQIPIKNNPEENEKALEKVRQDKLREVLAGHDGTWVAHPGLVPIAKEIFDTYMPEPNQIGRRPGANVTAADLMRAPEGPITEQGLRRNIDVGIRYLYAWLQGTGCVPIYNLMEDAATAEICRAQVWQWLKHGARLNDGRRVTPELVRQAIADVTRELEKQDGRPELARAIRLFDDLLGTSEFHEFLTLVAYEQIMEPALAVSS